MTEACEAGSIKGDSKYLVKDDGSVGVKKEFDVTVKVEANECVVCLSKNSEHCDVTSSSTETGTPLYEFLYKYTHADIANSPNYSKFICKTCLDLVNVLEHAEIEYFKLKEAFEAIINKNPLFESPVQSTSDVLNKIKNESEQYTDSKNDENDSEDEPLALTKKKRRSKLENRKKKTISTSKRKVKKDNEESWECTECTTRGKVGGQAALAAHLLMSHTVAAQAKRDAVKKEESPERSQSSIDNGSDDVFKLEGFDDEDDGSSLMPGVFSDGNESNSSVLTRKKRKTKLNKPVARQKREKVIHYCDKCNAKYTSIARLEQHKLKHEDSKPPYICEVCGAHYKHKRACDVHIAMHKGISDWKCVECNKLFPSKGALQRHNNIHTGKLNYQCDLCGKSFIHTSSFKMHKLSHSGVKPHSCDVCGLALMTRSHLKRHKRVHSGEKRHECATCGKRFSERYNLLAHARAHDGAPLSEAPARALDGATPAAAFAPRRRLFRCTFCVERFERRYMLERHCAVAHGRSLERPPPTPRNTMSKLLKAQAQRRDPPDQEKNSRSPDTKTSPATSPQKNILQAAGGAAVINASAWAGAYAAEFGLRQDYSH